MVLILPLLVHEGLCGSGVSLFHTCFHVFQLPLLCCQLVCMLHSILAQRQLSRRVKLVGCGLLLGRRIPVLGWGSSAVVVGWVVHGGTGGWGGKAHQPGQCAVSWCHGDHIHNGFWLITILHFWFLGSLTSSLRHNKQNNLYVRTDYQVIKSLGLVRFFYFLYSWKVIDIYIQQERIKCIKSDSKDIHNLTNNLYFK